MLGKRTRFLPITDKEFPRGQDCHIGGLTELVISLPWLEFQAQD
jgi:hypothetical protein